MTSALPPGATVLLVEDDYYQAEDARAALLAAGAVVLGPCAGPLEAMRLIDSGRPDCALLDVNLGQGPDFTLARTLISGGASLVFVSGYEDIVLPPDLATVPMVRKPAASDTLVAAVASALAGRSQT